MFEYRRCHFFEFIFQHRRAVSCKNKMSVFLIEYDVFKTITYVFDIFFEEVGASATKSAFPYHQLAIEWIYFLSAVRSVTENRATLKTHIQFDLRFSIDGGGGGEYWCDGNPNLNIFEMGVVIFHKELVFGSVGKIFENRFGELACICVQLHRNRDL